MSSTICTHCGAPERAGLVACPYCDSPYPGAGQGIECPKCRVDNDVARASCVHCGTSLVQTCVFCGGASGLVAVACGRCGEAFAGAEDRKRQREEQARNQQLLGLAATGLGALSAAAASPLGQSLLGQLVNEIKDEIGKG